MRTQAFSFFMLASSVAACDPQLPQSRVPINVEPAFNVSSILPSDNGIRAAQLDQMPGMVCEPNEAGDCSRLLPIRIAAAGAKVQIIPSTQITPSYHSLIDNKFTAKANAPFVVASGDAQSYFEYQATTVSIATFRDTQFPDHADVRKAVCQSAATPPGGFVYWLGGASLIIVSQKQFVRVKSALDVTATGFGAGGSTYNSSQRDIQNAWIGVSGYKIPVSCGPAPAGAPIAAPARRISASDHVSFGSALPK